MEYLPEALYRAADVRAADRRAAQHHGLGEGVLMERAGAVALDVLRERFPRARRLAVVCGPGNNGGDGYVLARRARDAGLHAEVFAPADPARLSGEARQACERWQSATGLAAHSDFSRLAGCELIVDALFGTGLERPLEAEWKTAVAAINTTPRPVLALDLPSGLHADSGRPLGAAVRAEVTLTFVGLKAGLFTGEGREHSGLILFDDLAVPAGAFEGLAVSARRITAGNLRGLLRPRLRHAHKGDVGPVLLLGGQPGMPGALRLAGEAAYRAGAGLVTLATHSDHAAALAASCPELIAHGLRDAEEVRHLAARVQAVAVGPGIGMEAWGERLTLAAFDLDRPLVVDAEALRHLARHPRRRADWVLTPHPGEAAALLGITTADVQSDRLRSACAIASRFGGVCVLKGNGSVIAGEANPVPWLCDRGGPALATAGSGDVLTGVVAALLAQGLAPVDAARLAVYAHAEAGDRAARQGERGLMTHDLLPPLRQVLNGLVHAD